MKCPYCGHENDENTIVCKRCKAEIPHEKKQEEINADSRTARKRKLRSE